jgi:hypothetical protein
VSVLEATTSPQLCHPRWMTQRSPDRPSLGPRVAQVAETLGTKLMPWQRHVADVALEVDPDTGLLVYRRIVLTVPRQSGKTTLLLAVMVHRALSWRRQRLVYTAQTRLKARKKWDEEHVPVLEASPYRGLFKVTRQIGQEGIRWRNGSIHALDAPSDEAAHGDVLDLGVIDEAFAQVDARVEQGMAPAMITRPQPQLWVVSTAGQSKAASPYLWRKIETGRVAADAGVTSGVAFFEWSAPNDADPADPATWRSCMPALGHTVTEAAVRAEFQDMDLGEFRRAYLNQWVDESPREWLVIGQQAWAALVDPGSSAVGAMAFAADVNPDRTWASIATVGRRRDGLLHVEVVDHHRGTAWVVPRLQELQTRWAPCALVLAPSGPGSSLLPEADAAGLEVLRPGIPDIAGACGAFYDASGANPDVQEAAILRHLDQPDLNLALAGAMRREVGDRWLWARKGVAVDLSPLVAATLALWGWQTKARQQVDYDPVGSIW